VVALPSGAEPIHHYGNKRYLQSGTGDDDFKRLSNFGL